MELELGLALPYQMNKGFDFLSSCDYNNDTYHHKRDVNVNRDEEEEEVDSKGLSLMLWSDHHHQPNQEDDKWKRLHLNEENYNNEEIMGWPPINSLRKESLHRRQAGDWMSDGQVAVAVGRVMRRSMYVKVKMEGVPIGRKIDLGLYDSYQALKDTLINNMFATKDDSRYGNYTILYQDKEGDWMLAGDVPWERFVESVQRMEIVRKNN